MSTQAKSDVRADAKFLRRVLMALIALTVLTGGLAALTTVQAMSANPKACLLFCE